MDEANIWALKKNRSVKLLLLRLGERLSFSSTRFPAPAHYDDQAIRIVRKKDNLSVYVYTYGQRVGRYGLDLEYPGVGESVFTEERFEGLDLEKALDIVVGHLGD